MEKFIKYMGMDVHGKTIAVAVADSRSSGHVAPEYPLGNPSADTNTKG